MESPATYPLPIPRLRLSRFPQSSTHDNQATPQAQAGPSRLPEVGLNTNLHPYSDNDDEDDQPTPKMTTSSIIPSLKNPGQAETPATRLRALLNRVPNSGGSSKTPIPQKPARSPPPPSEFDSDYEQEEDPPEGPSIARESLRDIFSRALREPGDTPQKRGAQPRRNSIDTSEVEASPRVAKERAKNKGKRRSLSDEEIENASKSGKSESSVRSSSQAASTFDSLRERLANSATQLKDEDPPSDYDRTTADDNHNDNNTFLRDLNSSRATPPAATSTPHMSLRMSMGSQYPFQSNLLEQDSEMQRAIDGLDSYEADSGSMQRQVPFPPNRPSKPQTPPARAQSALSHVRSSSLDKSHVLTSRRSSGEFRTSSRSSSSHSSAGHGDAHHEDEQDRIREREREWNKPKAPSRSNTPDLKHQHSHSRLSRSGSSPMAGNLTRRGSAASLLSFDDESARGSSIGSQSDYRERINELERERNIEREREWGKRHSNVPRPTSSLGVYSPSRSRTQSHPIRPDSGQSLLSPESRALHRHSSFNSPRASSPALSQDSHSEKDVMEVKVVHECERNWNAPRPKWSQHSTSFSSHRAGSSMPPSPSPSDSSSGPAHTHSTSSPRPRTQSLRTPGKGDSPSHQGHTADSNTLRTSTNVNRAPSPSPRAKPVSPTQSRLPRPRSPLPPQSKDDSNINSKPHSASGSSSASRFGFQYSKNRTPLPPIELEQESPDRQPPHHGRTPSSPSPTPSSRSRDHSLKPDTSHIPIKSPRREPVEVLSPEVSTHVDGNGHKRMLVESQDILKERSPSFVARVQTPDDEVEDVLSEQALETDEEDAIAQESTPTLRTVAPPPSDTPEASPPQSPVYTVEQQTTVTDDSYSHSQASQAPPTMEHVVQALSPPPSPHTEKTASPGNSFLSTPPRRSSFSASRTEFQTPSPPKNLPDLPGPPSSEDEHEDARTPGRVQYDAGGDVTATKTPRPPGAWNATPAPRNDPPGRKRANSLVAERDTSQESGLATPMPSLSRASTMPMQTPAPPGAWMPTPAPRKSILKVRFDTQPPESEQSTTEDVAESSNFLAPDVKEPKREMEDPIPEFWEPINPPTKHVRVDTTSPRPRTPEPPATPVSPTPKSPRKSASIRVLDAFGREQVPEKAKETSDPPAPTPATPRSRSAVRIVDAMGREVTAEAELPEATNEIREPPPLKEGDALSRVRQGLSELAQGLEEMSSSGDKSMDHVRVAHLDDLSRVARETREQISSTLQKESDLRSKLEPLRASMRRAKLLLPAVVDRRLSAFRINSWMFWGVLLLQLLLIMLMYRVSIMRARDLFLSTYYDPFYPDLHLYTIRPDTPISSHPWPSVMDTLRYEGWNAFTKNIRNNLSSSAHYWQTYAWQAWGSGDIPPNAPWPPT